MRIQFNSIYRQPNIKRKAVKAWLDRIVRDNNNTIVGLHYTFCSDEQLLEINQKYLNHDYYTDIITFDLSEGGNEIEGDIYISLDRVKDNAKTNLNNGHDELLRVMVHGLLHLIGFGDKTPKQIKLMRQKEDEAIHLYHEVFHVK